MKATKRGVAAIMIVGLAYGLGGCGWFLPPDLPDVQTIGFAPTEGAVQTTVTLVGQGFGATINGGSVHFSGVPAEIHSWSDANIVVRIPVVATPTGRRSVPVEVRRAGVVLGAGTFAVVRGILFETNRDGQWDIYVMNPDGSQQTNLTSHPQSDTGAVWSPDGTRIAFVSAREGNLDIYTMWADGSAPSNLTNHPKDDYYPVWSPDGTRIAFMTDREHTGVVLVSFDPMIIPGQFNVEIFVMNADGTGQANVTSNPAWDGYPSWSPNGERIVFQTGRDDGGLVVMGILPEGLGQEIYVIDADGSNPTRLSNSPGHDRYPVWSPDGSKIAFQSDRDGNAEIYAMNPDGTGQVRLTNNPAHDVMPSWSPDSRWIAFHSFRDGNAEIYKVRVTGESLTRLTNAPEFDWGPAWSPDGQQIVFQSARDGNLEIYRMDASGSSVMRLTTNPGIDASPCWGTRGWAVMI